MLDDELIRARHARRGRAMLALGFGVVAVSSAGLAQEAQPAYPPAPYYPPPYYPPPGYPPSAYPPPGYPGGPPAYPPPYAPPPAPSYEAPRRRPPPPRTGFQLGVRTGFSVPMGKATGAPGDELRDRYSVQVPFLLDLGAKLTPALYVGGYLGAGIGSEGADDRVEDLCDDKDANTENDIACSAYTLRAGVELRWYLNPAGLVDPWLSYGIGFESASQTIDDKPRRRSEHTTVNGVEFARLGAGFDWRLARGFGLGPFLELDLGRYGHTHTQVNGRTRFDGDISDAAVHGWLSLGLRGVVFP